MGEHKYSLKHFLRQAPNTLLDRYFHERGLLKDIDIAGLVETDIEPIFEALTELPDSSRPMIEDDFQMVHSVADEEGINAILEEADFHQVKLQDTFAKIDGFYGSALWTFLEHKRWLEDASRFRQVDELPKNYWRECDGIDATNPRDDEIACGGLGDALKKYFRNKDGRGKACTIEVCKRGSKYYYFAYTEDYSRTLIEYKENQLQRNIHRPVFQIVFVVDPQNGKFSTYYQGKSSTIHDLQGIFANEILIINLPESRDNNMYNLNSFKRRGYPFKYDRSSGIVDVRIKHIKFEMIGVDSHRILVDVNPSRRETIYDVMDDIFHTGDPETAGNRIPLSLIEVTKVGIKAFFIPDKRRKQPTRTFYISHPNRCTLEHDGKDQILRQMLIDSGIEPKPPQALKGQ